MRTPPEKLKIEKNEEAKSRSLGSCQQVISVQQTKCVKLVSPRVQKPQFADVCCGFKWQRK